MDVLKLTELIRSSIDRLSENKSTTMVGVITSGVALMSGAYFLYRSRAQKRAAKPGLTDLTGGHLSRDEVRAAFVNYSGSFAKEAGVAILEKNKTPNLVDTFYSLVTDFYEWGWGESFHFSIPLLGKSEQASDVATEAKIATLCKLKPGMKCADLGCGVGGPMRTIASFTGAQITGITINHYQVHRANLHNKRYGLESLCSACQGTFLSLDIADDVFDAAYAIEATCHAPDLLVAYGEAFRILKPGGIFVTCEWVTTAKFDPTNAQHVKAIDEINYGNGLPEMRSAKDCTDAAKNVGFDVLDDHDWAVQIPGCKPWYNRLERVYNRAMIANRFFVNFLSFLRMLPAGIKQVHDMLLDSAARGLIEAGKEGIFSPMHIIVVQKPLRSSQGA